MKVIVIGCGRVGSCVALELAREGWDVTVDRREGGGARRLGVNWTGGVRPRPRHGPRRSSLRAGDRGRRRCRRRDERRQHEHRDRPGGQEALRVECVVVRILDPARADSRGAACTRSARRRRHRSAHRTGARRQAPEGGLMYVLIAGGGKVGRTCAHAAAQGHEVTLIEQRRDRYERLEDELSTRCSAATQRRSTRSRGRGSRGRRTSSSPSPATTRTTWSSASSRSEEYGVEKVDRPRQRSSQPGAFRPVRDHPDRIRDLEHHRAGRA